MASEMNRASEVESMIKQVVMEFASDLEGYKVVLFGSRATGDAGERSDFDVGVVGDGPLPVKTFYAIQDALETLPTLYKIDWVDLTKVDNDFAEDALAEANVIYEY